MRLLAVLLALAATTAACSEDFFDPTPGRSPAPPPVQLIGQHIQMVAGEENAVRVSFKPKDVSVRVRISRSSVEGRVVACPLRTIDDALPPLAKCIADLPDGVRETLTTPQLGAIALVREGAAMTINLVLEYEEGGRTFSIRIPAIDRPSSASACKDNACNPFFEVTPVHNGRFTATVGWVGGVAHVELLEGRVLARAFSSTGSPYRVAAKNDGASPLTVTAQLNAPGEYALAITNPSGATLAAIQINATWP
ncbi:MAG: hypothetical protein WAT66_10130 [Actinomycetota bacterium]